MKVWMQTTTAVLAGALYAGAASAQTQAGVGTEEFGLTPKQLVEAVEKVEGLISKCMRDQGFSYIAVDYQTVRAAMAADKTIPGVSEEEFVSKYGMGVSTFYTGEPPQLSKGYNPARIGLGERNIANYQRLSPADQVAYNRALFGENTGATFVIGLESENFSMSGGCTRKGIEKVFPAEHIKSTFYNPKDVIVNKHPKMKAALSFYAREMNKAGFKYNHPDEVEPDIRQRLSALSNGGTIPLDKMSPAQRAALKELQDFERAVSRMNSKMQKEVIDPVEERIHEEMFARKPQ